MLQPGRLPLTVYTVVDEGETERLAAVEPVFQVYELTPLADNTTDEPAHTEAELTLITGAAVTYTTAVVSLVQPWEEVPITVYTVVAAGLTVMPAVVALLSQT